MENPQDMTAGLRLVAGIDLGLETEQVVSYAALFAALTHATVRLASFCKDTEIEKEGAVYEGHPGEVIPSLAEEGRYDLIVIGARGLSYVESVLIGGTTDAVLKSSYCPVLIIH